MDNYPKFMIYNEDYVQSIKRLSNNLIKTKGSGPVPNFRKTFNTCVTLYKNINKKIRSNKEVNEIEKLFYNNYGLIQNIIFKYDYKKLYRITHSNAKLRIFEITKTMLSYTDNITEERLLNAFKIFNQSSKLLLDELCSYKEAVILAILDNLLKIYQEQVNSQNFKFWPKFQVQNNIIDKYDCLSIENINYENSKSYKIAATKVRMSCLYNSLKNIEQYNDADFCSLNEIYSNVGGIDGSKEIIRLSKKFKISEKRVYESINNLSQKNNVRVEKVLFESQIAIRMNLLKYPIFTSVSTGKFVIITYGICFTLFVALVPLLVFLLLNRMIWVNYFLIAVNSMVIIKFVIDRILIFNVNIKTLDFVKDSNVFRIINFLKYLNVISVVSSIVLACLNKNYTLLYVSVDLGISGPILVLGEKFSQVRNRISAFKIIDDLKEFGVAPELLIEKAVVGYPVIHFINFGKLTFVADSLGRNFIVFNEKSIYHEFSNVFNNLGVSLLFDGCYTIPVFAAYKNSENKKFIYDEYSIRYFDEKTNEKLVYELLGNNCILVTVDSISKDLKITFNCFNCGNAEIEDNKLYFSDLKNSYCLEFDNESLIKKYELNNQSIEIFVELLKKEKLIRTQIKILIAESKIKINEIIINSIKENEIEIFREYRKLENVSLYKVLGLTENDLEIMDYFLQCVYYYPYTKDKYLYCAESGVVNTKNIALYEKNVKNMQSILNIFLLIYKSGQNFGFFIFLKTGSKKPKNKIFNFIKFIYTENLNIKNEQKILNNSMINYKDKIVKIEYKKQMYISYKNVDENKIKLMVPGRNNDRVGNLDDGILINKFYAENNQKLVIAGKYGGFKYLGDYYEINAKNSIISSVYDVFAFCGGKRYQISTSIIKNVLIHNNSKCEKQVNIENCQGRVESGIINNGVCFFTRLSLKNSQYISRRITVLFDKILANVYMNLSKVLITQVNDQIVKVKFLDNKKTLYFYSNHSCELITNRYSVQSIYSNSITTFVDVQNGLYLPALIFAFDLTLKAKSEQEIIIVFSENFEFLKQINFKNFEKLIENEKISNTVLSVIELFSQDEKVNLLVNSILINNLRVYLLSHFDIDKPVGVNVYVDCSCLKQFIAIDSNYVKSKIIEIMSHMFIEGDYLCEYLQFDGERKKRILDNCAVLDLIANYIEFTENYEILYEKAPYLTCKYHCYEFTKSFETILQHLFRNFEFALSEGSIDFYVVFYANASKILMYLENENKEWLIKQIINVKTKIIDIINNNDYSSIETITIFRLILLDFISMDDKIRMFDCVKKRNVNYNDSEKVLLIQVMSIINNKKSYLYDELVNPLKRSNVQNFRLDSIYAESLYYEHIIRNYIGLTNKYYGFYIKNFELDINTTINIYKQSKKYIVSFEKSKDNNCVIIDSKKTFEKEFIRYKNVEKFVKFCIN